MLIRHGLAGRCCALEVFDCAPTLAYHFLHKLRQVPQRLLLQIASPTSTEFKTYKQTHIHINPNSLEFRADPSDLCCTPQVISTKNICRTGTNHNAETQSDQSHLPMNQTITPNQHTWVARSGNAMRCADTNTSTSRHTG